VASDSKLSTEDAVLASLLYVERLNENLYAGEVHDTTLSFWILLSSPASLAFGINRDSISCAC
jgi:hypothetical protein